MQTSHHVENLTSFLRGQQRGMGAPSFVPLGGVGRRSFRLFGDGKVQVLAASLYPQALHACPWTSLGGLIGERHPEIVRNIDGCFYWCIL